MVTGILRPTIYYPIWYTFTRMVGTKCAKLAGVMATFVVSGLMHELIFYNGTRVPPTWEVTLYFVLQGVYTSLEIVVKEMVGDRFRLHPVISRFLTIAFLLATNGLFFAQVLRDGMVLKVNEEYGELVEFVKGAVPWPF
ncbi:Acyl-coa--sterol o-acyltransferase [Thalictrum thalictroides]|uniref:Acyl-coa--sterol o-acyltransferase n=1 Tax=Thalictrum thalictroides TaxID=46969 RepID=A0A7J6URX0_THATH|nr:Acyl-coa--sterol o-acyltransferase [Thalictrum thalictroides]